MKIVDNENFNSHAPCGARPRGAAGLLVWQAISTHTPLAGRDILIAGKILNVVISTHTPEDLRNMSDAISTHTPLAGRDQSVLDVGGNL